MMQQLVKRDLSHIWHPCTQMQDHEWLPLLTIEKGEGVWLYDYAGKRYLDAISSWWVNILGHSNPRINQAINQQLQKIEHVILAGCTHEPAILLAERLSQLTGFSYCFFSDNGSSAIEIALKMSYHFWLNTTGKQRTKFVALSNSYHGETLGALAVGDVGLYRDIYKPLLLERIIVPSPDCYHREAGETCADVAIRQFKILEQVLEEQAEDIAAIILEPLVQCAGSMRMYDPLYLKLVRQTCDKYNIHLIADEIAVGFGRTGTLFACEQAEIKADFLCLGKGITGGYLPLAVVMTDEMIYNAFYDEYQSLKAFLHSHSYSGNPLACVAALASLDILEQDDVIEKNKILIDALSQAKQLLSEHPHIGDVRQHGMIIAAEMVKDKTTKTSYPWQERRGLHVYQYGLEHEALLRPLGNVVYFMPPYVITTEQIESLAKTAWQGINLATQG